MSGAGEEYAAVPTIRRLTGETFHAAVPGLAGLLVDAVDDGASLGFCRPFDHAAAAAWWRAQQAEVASGAVTFWSAEGPEGVAGTVGLARSPMPNGRHRATVVKLIVHRKARGQGLARRLLATAEREAAERGVTLLVLDTQSGSPAEQLYRATGWIPYGVVPDYAVEPSGTLRDCSFFYKRIA